MARGRRHGAHWVKELLKGFLMRWIALLLALASCSVRADVVPTDFLGLLDEHNASRRAVGVAPLVWSAALAAEAQNWANQLSREDCKLRYDPDPQRRETTGQNLYRAFSGAPYQGYKRTSSEAAERWLREGSHYDHARHQCKQDVGSQCGAYLQVIWERTTAIGCGRARCETAEVWACHYAPRGGQEGLLPYGNQPQASLVAEPAPVQQCGWLGPTPGQQFSDEVERQLQRQ